MRYYTSDFDYPLPAERIAQVPLPDRAASRLLVLERASGAVRHGRFPDLLPLLTPADVLVLNASRVIPARLHGRREAGGAKGGASAEILVVRELEDGSWLAMGHPGGKLKPGRRVRIGADSVVEIVEVLGGGLRRVKFVGPLDAHATVARYGEVPLPPYIHRPPTDADRERYQTVYAEHDGSVAAPTAGLHFTSELLARAVATGVAVARLDLHIGPGTFKPVEAAELERHVMHPEAYAVSEAAAQTINARRAAGGQVWAVGTTVVRTLETLAHADGQVRAGAGETRLFIHPPYQFRAVDRLLTNFHLPRSTLLMLVCAFGGYEAVMAAYREAIQEGYRFYSYGDAMAII
ncbi:MAG: tRNA preQ1(34) S-adenosylmethionine ribosyltransferase-isomerase QueA [Gemmatimonadetes bacterium 13_1_40CM_70_11]|nr:MAG: tRNA preQ1(34) S-adenosylmethionine ribosyltransferase-isomerase QueA [Gemmatimonadetes bacterium 13_1_40CM_70_11]